MKWTTLLIWGMPDRIQDLTITLKFLGLYIVQRVMTNRFGLVLEKRNCMNVERRQCGAYHLCFAWSSLIS